MWAMSRIFFVPVPLKVACTTLPTRSGVSSMRYMSPLTSINSTSPPSALRRPAIKSASRSRPSRSRLPDSIETSSFRVSRSGPFSRWAAARTGSKTWEE